MPTIDSVIEVARSGRGAVAALPLTDTLKEVAADGRIVRTIPREGLWRAQTPQAFPREMIEAAFREAQRMRTFATDCAALCERIGRDVIVVQGSERAAKITEERDFARVETLVRLEE
jgi:2-C-methyl-D-erythritol 4-phosphate cytidylyltransferase